MPLHPNLHLLIPADGVLLEARIYLPRKLSLSALTTSARSTPTNLADLGNEQLDAIRGLKVDKVVVAAHPWGRLGGNMMFPVIAHHIPLAIFGGPSFPGTAENSAYATFNVRGVGLSGGSMPWPGCGIGSDGNDFAAVEKVVVDLVGGEVDVYRIGYSYGSNLALNAPISPPIARTMLISPAPTLFKAMTIFSGPTFAAGLSKALDRAEEARARGDAKSLWHVFGTADDFTGVGTLRTLGGDRQGEITSVEIEGCGHFYARDQDGAALRDAVASWISQA